MSKRDTLSKVLAVVGSVLVWLPVAAPIVFAFVALFRGAGFFRHLDFLMPGELFPVVLAGAALLIWAAFRMRSYRKLIIWILAIAIAALLGSQGLAVATGLASGARAAEGLWFVLVIGIFILFDLAVIALGVVGILLARRAFEKPAPKAVE
jgi:hypothetical protein